MCHNPVETAGALLAAIEPDLVSFLTLEGIATTPNGQAAINAFAAATKAVENWVPGTKSAEVIEAVNDFTTVFNTLPIPADAKTIADVILAGVAGAIGIIEANSPAPAEALAAATPDTVANVQTLHAHTVAANTETKVAALAGGYRPSFVTKTKVMLGDHGAIAGQWDSQWMKAVKAAGPKYAPLAA